jgi:hypothetical protein
VNPIAGRSAAYPRYERVFGEAIFARYANSERVPMHPIKNKRSLFVSIYSISETEISNGTQI